MMTKKKLSLIILITVVAFVTIFTGVYLYKRTATTVPFVANSADLPVYTTDNLAQYDGSDPNKAIYIGLNGYVYDVTPGKEFYVVGGAYHYLAGKDSSQDLNMIGGDIITRKYKVVGRLK
jgi:predicted heme/steroid binding protein